MEKLTAMQQKIYDFIADAIRNQGYPPSVREIGEAVGLKSPSTVHFHVKHLEELGYICKSGRKGRALTLTERPPFRRSRSIGPAGCPCWAMWPPAHPFWPKSALMIIFPSIRRGVTGSFLLCASGGNPC